MTGSRSLAVRAGVQTFRYRQSSLVFGESGKSTDTLFGTRVGCDGWTQTLPNWSAFRTPSHFGAGWGSFQRRSPSGGAAKGMPLKARTPDFRVIPDTSPLSVLTGSSIAAGIGAETATTSAAVHADRRRLFMTRARPQRPCGG